MRRRHDIGFQSFFSVFLRQHLLDRPADVRRKKNRSVPEPDPEDAAHVVDHHASAVRLLRLAVVVINLDPRAAQLEFIPAEDLPVGNPLFIQQLHRPLLKGVHRVVVVFPERRIENVRRQFPGPDRVVNRVNVIVVGVGVENHVHVRNIVRCKEFRQIAGVLSPVQDHRLPVAFQHISVAVQRVKRIDPKQVLVFPAFRLLLVNIDVAQRSARQHQRQHKAQDPAHFPSEHRQSPSAGFPGAFLYHFPALPVKLYPLLTIDRFLCYTMPYIPPQMLRPTRRSRSERIRRHEP